jgi:hypothetical protein
MSVEVVGRQGASGFKYAGTIQATKSGGQPVTYDVCEYDIGNIPTSQSFSVKFSVTNEAAFTPAASAMNSTVTAVSIITAKCNNLPSATPTVSALAAHWGSCQNRAYDVNFNVISAAIANSTLSNSAVAKVNTGGARQPMLSGGTAQRSMLASGASGGMLNSGRAVAPPGAINSNLGTNPGSASALNPQPLPPRTVSNTSNGKAPVLNKTSIGVKLGAPVQIARMTAPNQKNAAAILSMLRTQRQAADAEAQQMKLSLQPSGLTAQPETVMSSTAATNRYSTAATALTKINGTAAMCAQNPTMRILTVNGGQQPGLFTQDTQYNFYTITGCSFGSMGPNAKAYIYYQGTFHEDFKIEEWSDNGIKLHLDPNLAGVDDQVNLTLVVQRADGQQASKSGYKFYAARETVQLQSIPKSYFALDSFRPDIATFQNGLTSVYTSGSSASVKPNLAGMSAEVHWDGVDPTKSGDDLYDFSHLHSSFGLDSASMTYLNISCTDSDYNRLVTSSSQWEIDWYGNNGVRVRWQTQSCAYKPGSCGGAFQGDCFVFPGESNYGLNVWVSGPRGLDPWTGKPAN